MKAIEAISAILLVVGGLNWGLVGAFNFDLVRALFGSSFLTPTVYVVVGLAALVQIGLLTTRTRRPALVTA